MALQSAILIAPDRCTRNDRSCSSKSSDRLSVPRLNVGGRTTDSKRRPPVWSPELLCSMRSLEFTETESFILQSFNVLLELASFFGFKATQYESARIRLNGIAHWISLLPEETVGNALKLAKYKAAAFFASNKGLELPSFPFKSTETVDKPHFLLGGKFRIWQRRLAASSPKTFFEFLTSVSVGWKKGCPRPNRDVVAAGVMSTFHILTTEPVRPSWADIDEEEEEKKFSVDMKAEVVRTVKEIFSGSDFGAFLSTHFVPSTSANYINTRSQMGAVGFMLQEGVRYGIVKPLSIQSNIHKVELEGKEEGRYRDNEEDVGLGVIDTLKGDFHFAEFLTRLSVMAGKEPANVKLVGLSEAFKVRVISKGPPVCSTLLKIVQKFLWTTLKNMKTFKLIGQPVDHQIISDVVGALHLGEKYASVDYSAATDLLFSEYSDLVVRSIFDVTEFPEELKMPFRRLLTKHMIEHPDSGAMVAQKRGQLMGSIVSFPILCILNAVVCRVSCEISRNGRWLSTIQRIPGSKSYRSLTLGQCPLLINGDDALMRLTPQGYAAWLECSDVVGFSPSIGKTFFAPDFVQINSTNFVVVAPYISSGRTSRFEATRFVNMGLLYGQVRSSAGNSSKAGVVDKTGSVGSRMRELLHSSPDSCRDRLIGNFLNRNAETLSRCRLPWFLPEVVGGLGLVGSPCLDDFRLFCHVYSLLQGGMVRDSCPRSISDPASWQIRKISCRFLRQAKIPQRRLVAEEVQNLEGALGWLSSMLLFDPKVLSKEVSLYEELSVIDMAKKAIRFNEGFLSRAREPVRKGLRVERVEQQIRVASLIDDPLQETFIPDSEMLNRFVLANPLPIIDYVVRVTNRVEDLTRYGIERNPGPTIAEWKADNGVEMLQIYHICTCEECTDKLADIRRRLGRFFLFNHFWKEVLEGRECPISPYANLLLHELSGLVTKI